MISDSENWSFKSPERDELGRFTTFKLYQLQNLCRKTMDTMEEKQKKGSDNWLFFNDLYTAIGQCIMLMEEVDRSQETANWYKTMTEILNQRNNQLSQEIAGYKQLEFLVTTNKLEEFSEKINAMYKKNQILAELQAQREADNNQTAPNK